ncbi:unnamed protein product [Durusdinium trenchii]|uniref:EF-hand domain-containing protein n=1 Tax=Durusdinium trenchii TaxID=1381693 RepID=A0ABP0RQC8_9DINO
MSSRTSLTLLNKEALEESQTRLFARIAELLQHHQDRIEKKFESLDSKAGDLSPGFRLIDTRTSLQPIPPAGDDCPEQKRSPIHKETKDETALARPMRVSLGFMPNEYQSEVSQMSGYSPASSTSMSGIERGDRPKKVASRNRDLEIMQGQMRMAALRRQSTRISGRSRKGPGGPGGPGGGLGISQEMEDRRRSTQVTQRSTERSNGPSAEEETKPEGERRKSVREEAPVVANRRKSVKRTVFAHAHDESEAMRDYARQLHQMKTPDVAITEGSQGVGDTLRQRIRGIVSSVFFEALAGCIILSNAVVIGLEVEYMAINREYRSPVWFQTLHLLYAVVFALELGLRVCAFGSDLYNDGDLFRWTCLDFIIVVSSFIDVALAWSIQESKEDATGSSSSGLSAIRIMRVIRISRLIRVTRIAKLMMWLKALRTLIHSIIVTLKSLVWALVLLVLLWYVFAIILSQAAIERLVLLQDIPKDQWIPGDVALEFWWGSLGDSVSTLFMSITGGISWQIAENPLFALSGAWKVVFFAYISFTTFAVLNVMTGVFCQSAIESAARDHDMAMQNVMQDNRAFMRKFSHLFHMLDQDDTGFITLVELEERMEDPDVKTYFEVWTFFRLLDGDSGQEIDMDEFLYGCMRLRGEAKALDLAKLMHSHAWLAKQQVDFMMFCEEKFVQIQGFLADGVLEAWHLQS